MWQDNNELLYNDSRKQVEINLHNNLKTSFFFSAEFVSFSEIVLVLKNVFIGSVSFS